MANGGFTCKEKFLHVKVLGFEFWEFYSKASTLFGVYGADFTKGLSPSVGDIANHIPHSSKSGLLDEELFLVGSLGDFLLDFIFQIIYHLVDNIF